MVGKRVEHIVEPIVRFFEAGDPRQEIEQDEVGDAVLEQPPGLEIQTEPPHLHGHQQRQAENDRAGQRPAERDPIMTIGRGGLAGGRSRLSFRARHRSPTGVARPGSGLRR
jgi:hypothetical protein